MTRWELRLELLSDVVASATGASEGGHRGHSFVPGTMLLGAAAERLYGDQSIDSWEVFHGGKIRFLDAYPEVMGDGRSPARSWPVPASFHRDKTGASSVQNLAVGALRRVERPVQLRSGFTTPSGGHLPDPRRTYRLKVNRMAAASSPTGDAELFGYEALAAGTVLRAALVVGAGLEEGKGLDLAKRIVEALCDGEVRIGRSRRAEYGRVRVTWLRDAETSGGADGPGPSAADDGLVRVLCVSDLVLRDPATGMPTRVPSPRAFGLPQSSVWMADRSFVRGDRYSPFHGYRRHHRSERHTIVRGSVLTFSVAGDIEAATAAARKTCADGVGEHLEAGLGEVAVQPPLLLDGAPSFAPLTATWLRSPVAEVPAFTSLQRWAERQATHDVEEKAAQDLVDEWKPVFVRLSRTDGAPGRSQWGMVRGVASQAATADALSAALGLEGQGLLHRGVKKRGWMRPVRLRHSEAALVASPGEQPPREVTLAWLLGRLRERLSRDPDLTVEAHLVPVIRLLATEVSHELDRLARRKEARRG